MKITIRVEVEAGSKEAKQLASRLRALASAGSPITVEGDAIDQLAHDVVRAVASEIDRPRRRA